jgi:hypothetical protein
LVALAFELLFLTRKENEREREREREKERERERERERGKRKDFIRAIILHVYESSW